MLLDPDRALEIVLEHATPREPRPVRLSDALGRRLAEPVTAEGDHPPFPRAMMDGFAVRLADRGGRVPVAAEVAAGTASEQTLTDGQCFEIMTGAPCPAGTEAVVKVEETEREGNEVQLPHEVQAGQNIAPQGSLCRRGDPLVPAGTVITPLVVGVLASVGRRELSVRPAPTLAVITTGDELTEADDLAPAQIRDSNGPMLAALARACGVVAPVRLHAGDTTEALAEALHRADAADVVVLTGGVSAGRYDLVPQVLEERGATRRFHKVAQKPGKPLYFATRGRQLFFGLPGNPLSTHMCFHRYVAPALARAGGGDGAPGRARGRVTAAFQNRGDRHLFVLARARPDGDGWAVEPRPSKGSADLFTPAASNCYLRLPPGHGPVTAGAEVVFEWIAGYERWV